MLAIVAAVPLVIWIYLLLARGRFWLVSTRLDSNPEFNPNPQRVIAIIPARNEAATIGPTLQSLLQQTTGLVRIIVVDDESSDATPDVVRRIADSHGSDQVDLIHGAPLPSGWTGKLWALSQGVAKANKEAPDYLLFTDGDILHSPDSVRSLLSIAESGRYALVSYMARLACSTFAEKALIPAFVFFFFKLYPPAWIRSTRFRTAGAAGGCILIRRDVLLKIGGLAAIRDAVIDDCALARRVKQSGNSLWMNVTDEVISTRSYGSFAEIGRMISGSAYAQLKHSPMLLTLSLIGMSFTYLTPPLLLFSGNRPAAILGVAAWLVMAAAYWPMVRFYWGSWMWSFALPAIALFYMGAMCHSALQYWLRRGGVWKGRIQDARS